LTGLKKKKKKKCGETQTKTTEAANFDKDGKGGYNVNYRCGSI
jgi:hypothetical protein